MKTKFGTLGELFLINVKPTFSLDGSHGTPPIVRPSCRTSSYKRSSSCKATTVKPALRTSRVADKRFESVQLQKVVLNVPSRPSTDQNTFFLLMMFCANWGISQAPGGSLTSINRYHRHMKWLQTNNIRHHFLHRGSEAEGLVHTYHKEMQGVKCRWKISFSVIRPKKTLKTFSAFH